MDADYDLDMVGVIEGADKSSSVLYRWDYLRHYERLFRSFRDQPINFIEIGVGSGASMRVWKSYFTRAQIIGVDIRPHCAGFAEDRVRIEIGSQDDPEFLARICAEYPPSIIIDDGSHLSDHIVFTFERMFPNLAPGGFYVVEDMAFHFGEDANRWKGAAGVSASGYFLRIAESCLARSVQHVPDSGFARYSFERVDSIEFISSAVVLRKKAAPNDMSATLHFAEQYSRARPPDAAAHERIGQHILMHGGPLARADAEYERAIGVAGETPSLLRSVAELRVRQGRHAEAAATAERAAKLSDNPHDWALAGRLFARQGDHAAATGSYVRAVALQPGNMWYSWELSHAHERTGNLGEALVAARQALKMATGSQHEAGMQARVDEIRLKAGV